MILFGSLRKRDVLKASCFCKTYNFSLKGIEINQGRYLFLVVVHYEWNNSLIELG